MGVAVKKGVLVALGVKDAVGVVVGEEAKDVQDEKINVNRKRARKDGVNLFRMGCILLNYKKKCAQCFTIKSLPAESSQPHGDEPPCYCYEAASQAQKPLAAS
jgi:hypothetical protein